MKNGKEFAEKMFSEMEINNNEAQEKLYSTGNDELDNLLEKAYNEGYEAAQREFSDNKDNESHRGYGRAYVVGGGAGIAGRYAGKRATKKALKEGESLGDAEKKGERAAKNVGGAVGTVMGAEIVRRTGKALKATKPEIKEALQDAGIKLTKKNKRIATIGAASAIVAGSAGLGALGGKLGTKKNNKERRAKIKKNEE